MGISNSPKSNKAVIPFDTRKALKYYVYALRDPRNLEVFYIGKGKDERILQHVAESGKNPKSEKAKLKRVRDIEQAGKQVEHLFLRTGIETEAEAFAIEQAVIDSYAANRSSTAGAVQLTNLVAGHEHQEQGLASFETVLAKHSKSPTPAIERPVLVLKLNRKWEPDMNAEELLKVSRKAWAVSEQTRQKAEIALVISFGIVRGVYEINKHSWQPAADDKGKMKWQFDGVVTKSPELFGLIGTDMGAQVKVQKEFQVFLDGFTPTPPRKQ